MREVQSAARTLKFDATPLVIWLAEEIICLHEARSCGRSLYLSIPHRNIARCNERCNPPHHLGLSKQGRVTLIRHDDDFKLAASCQHLIERRPGQHI